MRVRAFEGNSGDSVLLTSTSGKNILVDGGLVKRQFGTVLSYQFNVAPELAKMRDQGERLDLICVSHVDQDHIGGILAMLNDEFDWRVHDHQVAQNLNPAEPEGLRAPEIDGIWHNAFQEQVGQNRGDLEVALLSAASNALASGGGPLSHGRDLYSQLANSLKEAAQVSRRIGAKQLDIPLNEEFGGKLVRRHSRSVPIELGDLTLTVLGPTTERLTELREKWNKWLTSSDTRHQIRDVRRDAERDEQLLLREGVRALLGLSGLGPEVGDRDDVTVQNVSSIVMIVEEDGKRVLFTGDARDDHIHEDLMATGFTDGDDHVHVDLLKVQHHGSENNFSLGFAQKVTADHYLFCGNGGHHNPDRRVVRELLDARVGPASIRTPHVDSNRPFKLWFTSDGSTFRADREHMQKVKKLVEDKIEGFPHASAHFSKEAFFDIHL
ncbi:MAG: MBL fold metallo-hydrolase [Pseudomonadota bacterium]